VTLYALTSQANFCFVNMFMLSQTSFVFQCQAYGYAGVCELSLLLCWSGEEHEGLHNPALVCALTPAHPPPSLTTTIATNTIITTTITTTTTTIITTTTTTTSG
jgi:hypothetical protein